MEKRKKEVVRSVFYSDDILGIFEYGESTFGEKAALSFFDDLLIIVRNLESQYYLHPECRHLTTKTKKYRNIILGSYLIIYRITANRIEVLRAFHISRSPKTIQGSKKIKID
jgi:plasmid stabilization system protein ParE